QVIGRLGVGLDNIDLTGAKERQIPVISARNANATSVSEYVIAAMLDASRSLRLANEDVRKGNWNRKQFTGIELNNRVLGLIGMDVIGYVQFVAPVDHVVQETGIKQVATVTEILKVSDFVSVHVPLTESTKYLLDLPAFKLMKPSAYVINSARGGIINEANL